MEENLVVVVIVPGLGPDPHPVQGPHPAVDRHQHPAVVQHQHPVVGPPLRLLPELRMLPDPHPPMDITLKSIYLNNT